MRCYKGLLREEVVGVTLQVEGFTTVVCVVEKKNDEKEERVDDE